VTAKTGRDRHLSNLTVPKAFEAAKLIRRKCADFRQGAGYILVTHAHSKEAEYGCKWIISHSIFHLQPCATGSGPYMGTAFAS